MHLFTALIEQILIPGYPKDNRYIPYYDFDGSVVLSEIFPSIVSERALNYLKIRAAHSLTGNASALGGGSPNIADGAYTTEPTFRAAPGFPFNGLGGFLLSTNIANPNIKPEKITENDIGVELVFFTTGSHLSLMFISRN